MEDTILNKTEAAAMLGVSRTTMYKLIQDKKIPAHKLGKKTVFMKSELLAYIKSN